MISAREIAYGLYGAYRLARLDANGMAFFNRTIDGFWRSFFAAVIAAPGYAVLIGLRFADGPRLEMLEAAGGTRVFMVESIAYVISWVAFPLAMFHISSLIDRKEEYLGFIVAYNWAGVIQVVVFLPVAVINASDAVPAFGAGFLAFAVTLAILYYQWFITRTALRLGAMPAVAIVGVDLMLALLISTFADVILYAHMPV